MITDGILGALSIINEQLKTPEARQAGEDIWMMLADFCEDEWEEMSLKEKQEWVKGYIREPKNDGKATTEELKRMIVDLRIDLVKTTIPRGHCPYAYYSIIKPIADCNDIDCDECHTLFFKKMEENIKKEVEQL